MATELAITETYADVRNLIADVCIKFARTTGQLHQLDDLLSEGNIAFMEAYASHDGSKSSFSTYTRNKVWWRLHHEYRKQQAVSRAPKGKRVETRLSNLIALGDGWERVVSDLSDDATYLMELVQNPPRDLIFVSMVSICRRRLFGYLRRKQGWTQQRIHNAYTEVHDALGEL